MRRQDSGSSSAGDPDDPEWVVIDGRRKRFSYEVTEVLPGSAQLAVKGAARRDPVEGLRAFLIGCSFPRLGSGPRFFWVDLCHGNRDQRQQVASVASPHVLAFVLVMAAPRFAADWITRYYARPRPDLPLSGRELGRQLLDRAGLHDVPIGRMAETTDRPFEAEYVFAGRFVGLGSEVDTKHSLAAYALAAHGVGQAIQFRAGRLWYDERPRRALGLAVYAFPLLLVAGFLVLAVAPSGAPYASVPLVLAIAAPVTMIGVLLSLHIWSDLRVDFGQALPLLAAGYLGPEDLRAARRLLVMRALSLAVFAVACLLAGVSALLVRS